MGAGATEQVIWEVSAVIRRIERNRRTHGFEISDMRAGLRSVPNTHVMFI